MKTIIQIIFLLQLFLSTNIISQSNLDEKWITFFEKTDSLDSPNYTETMKYFKMFADNSEYVKMESFGVSPQGRDLFYLVISKKKLFTPQSIKENNQPLILIQNGIHSGEIEGKDACMLMLREILITKEKAHLIENVNLIIIPIFNVDGHERNSQYNRINQNGPINIGWRTTAQNLNLNRDYLKADTPEMRALLKLFNNWVPDIYIDNHSTNGADFQYDVTYIANQHQNLPNVLRKWNKEKFIPTIIKSAEDKGFLISPYVYFNNTLEDGLNGFVSTPRFSTGFASLHNRAEVTIETHMLKPFKNRVQSTKAIMEGIVNYVNNNSKELVDVNKQADADNIKRYITEKKDFPITYKMTEKYDLINFKGFKKKNVYSEVLGVSYEIYTDEKIDMQIPYFNYGEVDETLVLPEFYVVPPEWTEVIEVIKSHEINYDVISENKKFDAEIYNFKNVSIPSSTYEGRTMPDYSYDVIKNKVEVPKGSIKIPVNQRTLSVLVNLLEPKGPDSFVKWGFFNRIFERKEYYEVYSFVPIAKKMLEDNPKLKEEFENKISTDVSFQSDYRARLNFLYKRSKYYDKKHNVYPVLRIMKNK